MSPTTPRSRRPSFALLAASLCIASALHAEPTADEVLTTLGFSPTDKQRVLHGEFVTSKVGAVSDRDLAFAVAFTVKTSPDELVKQVVDGTLVAADTQIHAHGTIDGEGTLADFAGLQLTADEAKALANAEAGDAMNWSTAELTAFAKLRGAPVEAVQDQLRGALLGRVRAYRAAGLAGLEPYDRGHGGAADVAPDLQKATLGATVMQRYVPSMQTLLLEYPKGTLPGMQQRFIWLKSIIRGKPTYVLAHILAAGSGGARAVARREFYASTGYNAEQSVAGFLPVEGGTVVVCLSHAFTDQVAGAGGSTKRSIGSRVMAGQMKEIFERGRTRIEK